MFNSHVICMLETKLSLVMNKREEALLTGDADKYNAYDRLVDMFATQAWKERIA